MKPRGAPTSLPPASAVTETAARVDIIEHADAGKMGDTPTGAVVPLAELERRAVVAALDHCNGNRASAARALGVSVATLRRKLREYGVAA